MLFPTEDPDQITFSLSQEALEEAILHLYKIHESNTRGHKNPDLLTMEDLLIKLSYLNPTRYQIKKARISLYHNNKLILVKDPHPKNHTHFNGVSYKISPFLAEI